MAPSAFRLQHQGRLVRPFFFQELPMAPICVVVQAGSGADGGSGQWIEVDDADAVRCAVAKGCPALGQEDAHTWSVLAYDGLPDFGPRPDLDELLAWLDAVGEYGLPFQALWASGSFGCVLQATGAFVDSYQGIYWMRSRGRGSRRGRSRSSIQRVGRRWIPTSRSQSRRRTCGASWKARFPAWRPGRTAPWRQREGTQIQRDGARGRGNVEGDWRFRGVRVRPVRT